jgi:uncharacterized membrane-anchored protein
MQAGLMRTAASVFRMEGDLSQRIVEAHSLAFRETVAVERHLYAHRTADDVESRAQAVLRHHFHRTSGAFQIAAIGDQPE